MSAESGTADHTDNCFTILTVEKGWDLFIRNSWHTEIQENEAKT
jgi:hypothetical protein